MARKKYQTKNVQRDLILKLTQLTSNDEIFWSDFSDATMKSNFQTYYKGFTMETLSLSSEPPKLFIRSGYQEIMIMEDIPCALCDLLSAIYAQFRRNGEILQDDEESKEEQKERMDEIMKSILKKISS